MTLGGGLPALIALSGRMMFWLLGLLTCYLNACGFRGGGLGVLKFHTNGMVLWAICDKMLWDELVSRMVDAISGYRGGVGGFN